MGTITINGRPFEVEWVRLRTSPHGQVQKYYALVDSGGAIFFTVRNPDNPKLMQLVDRYGVPSHDLSGVFLTDVDGPLEVASP